MFCEVCGIRGLNLNEMAVDPETKLFVGPCCIGKKEVVVGLEVSSKKGLKAYLKYNGLKLEYEKPFHELSIANERNQMPVEGTPSDTSKEVKTEETEVNKELWPKGTPVGEA